MKAIWDGREEFSYDSRTDPAPKNASMERENNSPLDIVKLIDSLQLSAKASNDAKAVLNLLFEAEIYARGGLPIYDIHH